MPSKLATKRRFLKRFRGRNYIDFEFSYFAQMSKRQLAAFKKMNKWKRIPKNWKSVHKTSNQKAREYLIQYNKRKYKIDKIAAQYRIKEPFFYVHVRKIRIDMPYPDDFYTSMYDIWDDVEPYIGKGQEFWIQYPVTVKTTSTRVTNYSNTVVMTVDSQESWMKDAPLHVMEVVQNIQENYDVKIPGAETVDDPKYLPGVDHIILNVKIWEPNRP